MNWNEEVKSYLKNEISSRGISNDDLVKYLETIGIKETKASIDSKISRGTFSAVFMIQCLTALGCDKIQLPSSQEIISNETQSIEASNKINFYDSKYKTHYIDISQPENQNTSNNTVISLFSGAGGFDIGLEQAGFSTLVCVDNDKDCRETLKFNRPSWIVFDKETKEQNGKTIYRAPGNIREIEPQELLDESNKKKGEITLVVGGAPCQPFSNMGKREGKKDKTNGDLFLEFVRFVKGIEPQAFIFENVAGITQKKHAEVIKYMTNQFSGMDYGISHTILNAANYGVPQKRERFFLVGIKGTKTPAFPLPTHFKDERSWKVFTKDFDFQPKTNPLPWVSVSDCFNTIPRNYKRRNDYAVMKISDVVLNRMRYVEQGQNFKVLPMNLRPNCWKNGKHLGSDTFGRLDEKQPSVTIRTAAYNPSKGRYIHPTEDRGLNTIEMSTIQGFPFDWTFKSVDRKKITLVSAGRQIGNAVPPPLARALGVAIKKQLSKVRSE